MIVTDGYVEAIPKQRVSALAATTRIHAIVTRDGNPSAAAQRRHRVLAAREVAVMIRVSEAVLPGHPDKLCDFVAESIVQAALAVDEEAYAQIEAGIWCDQLWLSGGYAARGAKLGRRADRDRSARLDRASRNPRCDVANRGR